MAKLIYFVFVKTRDLTVIVLHFANFFLSIWKAIFKQFNFTVNRKSLCKMVSVTMGIQDQASGEVQVSIEAEVSHS